MTHAPFRMFLPTMAAIAVLAMPLAVRAQAAERSGKDVVEAVCAGCHAKGVNGAPRIGDNKAWAKRASQGLTSLTGNALKGIRGMPSHGGKLELTDLEIGRAVAYMVNQSGGKWVEPATAKDMMAERGGKQVVDAQCSKCHAQGTGGAPKIGDRNAWAPRMKQGMDALVASAIRGHGGMPPRGDKADLTDGEIRSAISYMFNPAASTSKAKPAAAAAPDRMVKTVGGVEVRVGVLAADALRTRPNTDPKMYGGIPSGQGYYAVTVSLHDKASKAEIKDAQVEARVSNPMTGETRKLESATINNAVSYGGYFQMPGKDPYTVTVKVQRPGAPAPIEAKFDLRR